jgi:hypothetical protein
MVGVPGRGFQVVACYRPLRELNHMIGAVIWLDSYTHEDSNYWG